MAYIKIDVTNRITAASYDFHCGEGEIEVDIPSEVSFSDIHDYRYENGDFIHDPRPEQEPPASPETETSVWDELDAAYQEGVDSV